jgi:hypothetical protein
MGGRRFALLTAAMVLLAGGSSARAAIMDFNSLPLGFLTPPNVPYMEDGYTLISSSGTSVVDTPNDGSRLVEPNSGGTLFTLFESANQNFGIFTVDVAGGPTNGSQITFTGNKFGGGTVSSTFTLTGNPAPTIHLLNWLPNNGITLTSMTVSFPPGVVAATDTYEFSTVVPEPASLGLIMLAGLALRRGREALRGRS